MAGVARVSSLYVASAEPHSGESRLALGMLEQLSPAREQAQLGAPA